MIKIGLIGYGYWGVNLLRNLMSLKDCEVHTLCDSSNERLEIARSLYPNLNVDTNADSILKNPNIDAVIIATPVHTHYKLAKTALLNNKHVLVEKPITSNVKEAIELIELATIRNLRLMVDHTFLYTGSVEAIKRMLDEGVLGKLNYIDSTRVNLGLFQQDINVLWDLAPHDLSILNYLVSEQPISVNATGACHTGNGLENMAYATIKYESGFIAHINCSWSSPVKIRTMLIGGDKKMIVYDDIQPTEKIKVYDTRFEVKSKNDINKMLVEYRVGDIFIPKIDTQEALIKMLYDFVHCIKTEDTPRSNCNIALQTIKILEAINKSLKENGKKIKL